MNQSLPLLTPLRGIAALMVVLFHARLLLFPQWMESIAGVTQLIENGYLWVDLFFILSGLVLAHVYGEAFTAPRRTVSYGRFLWLRLTRVYPLYVVTLVLLVGWELYKARHGVGFYGGPLFKMWEWEGMPPFGSPFTPAEALPSALLLLQVVTDQGLTWNFAAWSLSVEWISYLLFPLLIPLAVTRSRWSHLAPLLALTVLAFIVHSRETLDVTSGALAVGRGVSEFVLGLWLLPRVKAARSLPMMQRDLPLLIAFLLPFVLLQFTMTPQLTLLLICAYVLLIWIAASQGKRQSPLLHLLDNRLTNWLGDLSYSIYLLHALVLLTGCELIHYLAPEFTAWWYAQTNPLLGVAATLLMLGVLIALSAVSYHLFERPLQRRLRRVGQARQPALERAG
ncbi:acyltransferase family protein [Aeromonas enteropelogenes]|uniref:acyltransferase family protein n=1 Tax=Aeromonas enteropelogenes TaxID=29489 RepID=UPI001CC079ED|nr:acyltransferase [Aeromonas enteropelogenes]UAK70486.1 acyltransferase [Aeromonas enteropelogenes]